MNILITGGLGFIGSHLATHFTNQGHNLTVVDNLYSESAKEKARDRKKYPSSMEANLIKFIEKDITEDISGLFKDIDIVFHFAAISSLPECQSDPMLAYKNNHLGTINVLNECKKENIKKIIFASTSAIYENNTKFPHEESDEVNPSLIYSLTKKHSEDICQSYIKNYGMDISIIRFFNVYGPNQDCKRISPPLTIYLIYSLLKGERPVLHSDGKQQRDYVYIKDLIDLCEMVMCYKSNVLVNACSNQTISVNEIYEIVEENVQSGIKPHFRESKNLWNNYPLLKDLDPSIIEEEVNKYTLGSNKVAEEILDWIPKYTMESGLKEMVEYYRKKIM